MSTRLRWYVGAVCAAGVLVLAALLPGIDLDRVEQVAGAVAVFAAFVVVGELVSIPIHDRNRVKELSVTATFAYGLVPLAGTGVAVVVFIVGSVTVDLVRRKGMVKTAFNAAQ